MKKYKNNKKRELKNKTLKNKKDSLVTSKYHIKIKDIVKDIDINIVMKLISEILNYFNN